MEDQLKITLSHAISEFNANRAAILQLANEEGGQNYVLKIEGEYDALRDAYFEILKRQLDKNNHLYDQLLTAANSETEKLRASVNQLTNITEIINLATAVVSLVGRIIIVLGI